MVNVSATPSPLPMKRIVDAAPLEKVPAKLSVFVADFVMMVALLVKAPLILAAKVPVPTVIVPLFVRL